ncbi:hypothetical protein F4804DRAFT_173657 [Jackrogersella minutella]|nr:hypothetical protein F4804DRAFT_173657 [Jackrogersella minutella]
MSPASSAPIANTSSSPAAHVTATYINSKSANDSSLTSTTSFALSMPITLPHSDSVAHKTAYLNTLCETVSLLQERVNSELTARMDEEAREVAAMSTTSTGTKGNKSVGISGIDETAEEENYGEEVVEDEG